MQKILAFLKKLREFSRAQLWTKTMACGGIVQHENDSRKL